MAAKYGASLAGQVGPPLPESHSYGDSLVVMEPIARGRRSLAGLSAMAGQHGAWADCPGALHPSGAERA